METDLKSTVFHKIYKLEKKIGIGAFGIVYAGINLENQQKIAIKLEETSSKVPQLLFEAKLYYHMHNDLSKTKVLPHVYYAGTEGKYNIMAMDLLGRDLEAQLYKCGGKFSLKTVCMLAIQLIQRIQYLHEKSYIHRDLKPDNFLCGRDQDNKNIYLIDYGLAKRYLERNGQHIKKLQTGCFTGTARYASINTHLGYELSRKDDMESLGYCFIFFLKGSLP